MKARSLRRNAREVATKILIPGVELCLARYIGHLSISLDSLIEPSLNLSFFRRTTGQVGARGRIPVEEETEEEEEEEAEDEEEEEEEEAEYEEEGLSLVLEIVKQTVGRSTKNKREHVSRSYLEGSEFKKMTCTLGISEGSLYHPQTTLDPSRLATELAKNERNTIEHNQSDFHIL
ncbi:hypothetical protein HZH68_003406 [Vespula germanica]|uniref:Uncharacterized protein n=1 Tax=Vespula germanica TaxID=30212 RepID=A0A834NP55_VESGE|nr:hypothetical protein HZH68_003406 [Vespula germanica]